MSDQSNGKQPTSPVAPVVGGEKVWLAICLAAILAGVILRIYHLASRPLWDDEAFTSFVACRGLSHFREAIRLDTHPPLFYLLTAASTALFGLNEVGLRLPSLVAGLALIGIGYGVGRSLWGRSAGLTAAALVAACPLLIYQSQEARSYSLLSLLLFVATWAWWRHAAQPTLRDGILAALAGSAAVATHYFGVMVFAIAGAALLLRCRGRWLGAGLPLAANVVAFLPVMALLHVQTGRYGSTRFPMDHSLASSVARSLLLVANGSYPSGMLKLAGFLLFLVGLAVTVVCAARAQTLRSGLFFAGGSAVLVLGFLIAGYVLHRWPMRDAYVSLLAPFVAVLVSSAATPSFPKRLGALAAGAVLAAFFTGDAVLAAPHGRWNPDFPGGLARVEAARPDAVLLARPWGDLGCYSFYAPDATPIGVLGLDPPEPPTVEAIIAGRQIVAAPELIRSARRVCIVGKDTGVNGFDFFGRALSTAGFRLDTDVDHLGVRTAIWSRSTTSARMSRP